MTETRRDFLIKTGLIAGGVAIGAIRPWELLFNRRSNLAPEIVMPYHLFKYQINNLLPLAVSPERLLPPPDLGSAYTLARLGDRKWQQILLDNYRGAAISTSAESYSRSPSENLSIHDFIRTNTGDTRFMLTRDPMGGGYLQVPLKEYDDLELPNGEKFEGIKIFSHDPSGVGLLEEVRLIVPPTSKRLTPQDLANWIKKIYIVLDDSNVFSFDPNELFSGKDPLHGKYENGAFIFSPLRSYRRARVYLAPVPGRSTALWYRVVGQDFDPAISRHIKLQENNQKQRSDFLATVQTIENIPIIHSYSHQKRELIAGSVWENTIDTDGYGNLTFRVPNAKDLSNIRVNIRYPNNEAPPIDISLQQLIGIPHADLALNNNFLSVSSGVNGGINIAFQQGLPLPKGTEITVKASSDTKTEILWQYEPSQIGNMRFGILNQTLAASASDEGKQTFQPVPDDFIVSQMMLYFDEPSIDINLYNKIGFDPWNGNRLTFHRGFLEGNIYLLTSEGLSISLFTGLEDVVGGFYDVGSVQPSTTIGNKQKLFFYGNGQYLYRLNAENNLEKIDYYNRGNMFALMWSDTFMRLQKGDRIMVLPGVGKFETARSTITLSGFYKVKDVKQ